MTASGPHLDAPATPAPYHEGAPAPPEPLDDVEAGLAPTGPLPIIAPRRVGGTGLALHPIALGTSAFGRDVDDAEASRILDRFLGRGGRLVDTVGGHYGADAERFVGRWLDSRGGRDRVVLASRAGAGPDGPGLDPVGLVRAVEASLTRLGTDHLDLLYLAGEDPAARLDETLATADWLRESGKVRYFGASDVTVDRLIEARILASTGLPRLEAVQCRYDLAHRSAFEGDLRIATAAQGLAVMPYSSLSPGSLAGRARTREDGGARAVVARAADRLNLRTHRILAALERVAAEQGDAVGIEAVAFAWLLAKRGVVAPVANVHCTAQLDAVLAAAGVRLTRAQMLELDRVSE